LLALLKAKKLVLLGLVGVGAGITKLFGKKDDAEA